MVEINKTKPEQTAGGPELNRNNVQDAKQVLDNKTEGPMHDAKNKAKRILFVDDYARIRDIFARLIRQVLVNSDVTSAASGTEALDLLKAEDFDLIITDLNMSGMNGEEFARKAKELKNIPIILSTTSSFAFGTDSPFDHVLPKPINLDKLKKILNAL